MKDDLGQINNQVDKVLMNRNFSLIVSAKVEESQMLSKEEGPRIRYTIQRALQHDFKAENTELLKRLEIYQNKD